MSDRCVKYCMRVEKELPGSGTDVPSKELVPTGQEIQNQPQKWKKQKHRVNVMCSASGTLGAWIQDAKTPNTATEEDTDNKTQGCWGGILSQEIKTCLYRQTEPLNNAK